jgi:hypothetical protein
MGPRQLTGVFCECRSDELLHDASDLLPRYELDRDGFGFVTATADDREAT